MTEMAQDRFPACSRILRLLWVTAVAGLLVAFFYREDQLFRMDGQVKAIVLPLFALVAGLLLLRERAGRLPLTAALAAGYAGIALAVSLVELDLARGTLEHAFYLVSIPMAAVIGARWEWPSEETFLPIAVALGAGALVVGGRIGPLYTALPIGLACISLTRGLRHTVFSAALVIIVALSWTGYGPSTTAQFGVALIFLVARYFLDHVRQVRLRVATVAGVGLVAVILSTSIVAAALIGNSTFLVSGRIVEGGPTSLDASNTQRTYEFEAVRRQLDTPARRLFGAGAAGTVDLTWSPDSLTLAAAGRDLAAVEDVHLLSAFVYLKSGVVGLLLVTASAILLLVQSARLLFRFPESALIAAALTIGIVNSLAGATQFFVNPLTWLFAGAAAHRLSFPQPPRVDTDRFRRRCQDGLH